MGKKIMRIFIFFAILISATLFPCRISAMPVMGRIILIDAGHGGWDPGKQVQNVVDEKQINLSIAEFLQIYLEQGGATVFMTRATDTALAKRKTPDLDARGQMVKEFSTEIFVSIHQNAYPNASAKGAQVFYYDGSERSKALAEAIQSNMCDFLAGSVCREAKANKEYYVLRKTAAPAVIVECGFMTNSEEAAMLANTEYQQKVAWAIYMGIIEYFSKEFPAEPS